MRDEADITRVADFSLCVEHSPPGYTPARAAFAARFNPGPTRAFNGWYPAPTQLHVHTLRDVVLDAGLCVLMKGDARLRASLYCIPEEAFAAVTSRPDALRDIGTDLPVILGYNVLHRNHYHWVAQCLPAIAACLRQHGTQGVAIAIPNPSETQRESLRLLGHSNIPLIALDPTLQYRIPHLLFSDCSTGASSFANSRIAAQTYAQMRKSIGGRRTGADRIYIARTDATNRVMREEAALITLLRTRGFQIVVPGELSLREQARIFRDARLIVGPHGAGMANIVFCTQGAIIYELVPAHYENSCFCNLAITCGLDYLADSFPSETEGPPFLAPWSIDLTRITARLDELDAVLATRATA